MLLIFVYRLKTLSLPKSHNMELKEIAAQFALKGNIREIKPLGEGFINDTFVVRTDGDSPDYILQRKNKSIFPDIPGMMDNIERVTAHLHAKVEAAGGNPDEEVLNVVRTRQGVPYFVDDTGEYWAMCLYVPDSVTYDRADTPELAAKGGEGLGKFQAMLLDFDETLCETIPGFHNIEFRFQQWDDAVRADRAGRVAAVQEEIGWIDEQRERMMNFQNLVKEGVIPKHVTHNDAKIANILFDRNGTVKCVIDLDTLMSAPLLNDFGDAIRTYANTGAEDEPDLSRVGLSLPMFEGYTKGYLSELGHLLTPVEIEWLPFGPLFLTYEQALRFLMDYINGDTYYKTKYPEHNLVRARAQFELFRSMLANYDEMKRIINAYAN